MAGFFNPRAWTLGIRGPSLPKADVELKALFVQATKLRLASPLAEKTRTDFAADLVGDLFKAFPGGFSATIIDALLSLFEDVATQECIGPAPMEGLETSPNHPEHKSLRLYLQKQIAFFSDYDTRMEHLRLYLLDATSVLLGSVPESAISAHDELNLFEIPFYTMMSDFAGTLEAVINGSFHRPLQDSGLLINMQQQFERNIMSVSKIDPNNPPSNIHKYTMPSQIRDLQGGDLVEGYFHNTAFHKFLKTDLPLVISDQSRLEHSYILAGSGHGKTQLMQKFILLDLARATQGTHSLVIMDSQGDLISKVARLDLFNPDMKGTSEFGGILSDKIVIIDPNDVDFPAAINMFAMNETRMASYGSAEREKVQNSAIELYEHFFSELLGAELTARQGMVFKYLARLMLEIPDATIITLRDLMDDAKPFIPYMDKLQGSARVFFAREFFSPSFNATKKQISKRLWGVLSTPAFERLFSSPENKVDLFKLLNDGHIILINTAKDMLKENGASLYGRFFISMLTQAIMERSVIPEKERTPTFFYIDECQDYFDANVELLLAQGRKYACGICLSHQHQDQLSAAERGSVLANTSLKLVGGVNAKDAKALATEMGCRADFLQSMYKADDNSETEFALWVRNYIREAVSVSVPIGMMETLPAMSDAAYERVQQTNRDLYSWEYAQTDNSLEITFPGYTRPEEDEVVESIGDKSVGDEGSGDDANDDEISAGEPDIKSTSRIDPQTAGVDTQELDFNSDPTGIIELEKNKDSGRGGSLHIETQSRLTSLAHHFGWKAEPEYSVEDGYVDVWLSRDGRSIACEITVSTPNTYEIQNIEKCLNAGADEVWLISENAHKLDQIRKALGHTPKVWFFAPNALEAELRARTPTETHSIQTIRGYETDVIMSYLPDDEVEIRKERLAYILSKHTS